jgi:two-component system, LytTR family, response regulator
MGIRAVIVDDSDMDRFNLRVLLRRCPGVNVVAEAADIDGASETIQREKPDVVFLDIQMPGGSGFDVLERLPEAPHIIFVTAFDHYAIKAFEVNALDYLLKPILLDRLRAALARLPADDPNPPPPPHVTRPLTQDELLFVRSGHRQFFIPVAQVSAVCAEGDCSQLHVAGAAPRPVRRRMAEWAEVLPADLFLRVDRSLIVNRTMVRGIERVTRTYARLTVAGVDEPIVIGRAGIEALQEALPL